MNSNNCPIPKAKHVKKKKKKKKKEKKEEEEAENVDAQRRRAIQTAPVGSQFVAQA